MRLQYNEIERSIEIEDELRNHYFLLKIVMILNLISAIFQLIDVKETGIGLIEILSMLSGIISLLFFYLVILKRTFINEIPIEKIERLTEKSIFGTKQFSFKLKNGKNRDLPVVESQREYNELKKFFSEIGIVS
ncbi:MAG: hypothetical protein WBG71_04965 [Leeuwenhoekiella sp.]